MNQTLDAYQAYLQFTQKKSRRTIEAYMNNMYAFCRYMEKEHLDPLQASLKDLDAFIESYALDHQSASLNQMISTLRSYYSFLLLFSYRKDNPAANLKSLQKKQHLPGYYTLSEIQDILNSFEQTEKGLYEKLIFVMLYSCGLRVSELCELSLNQVFLDSLFLRISGKGDKTRTVPFNTLCKSLIEQYLPVRQAWMEKKSSRLFITPKGKPLTRGMVYHLIQKINEKNGITRKLSPHSLRHSYATHLLNGQADLRIVQELLGHENIATTQIYTHVESSRLKKAYDLSFPKPETGEKKNKEDENGN